MAKNDHVCRVCDTPLIVGENITQNSVAHYDYVCQPCNREHQREYNHAHREQKQKYHREYNRVHREHKTTYQREYNHRTGRHQPMSKNRNCASFLGVSVAEHVLSRVFKHVERMPFGNPGYDFICGGGYMIDVKSACRHVQENNRDRWMFRINKNQIADYFLCLAFDNREDLNPEHIWLIRGGDINDHISTSISESALHKWDKYQLEIDKVISCCDTMKEHTN